MNSLDPFSCFQVVVHQTCYSSKYLAQTDTIDVIITKLALRTNDYKNTIINKYFSVSSSYTMQHKNFCCAKILGIPNTKISAAVKFLKTRIQRNPAYKTFLAPKSLGTRIQKLVSRQNPWKPEHHNLFCAKKLGNSNGYTNVPRRLNKFSESEVLWYFLLT